MRRINSGTQNKVLIGIIAWLLLALVLGASGIASRLTPPFPQIVLFGLVLILLLLFWLSRSFRNWLLEIDIRLLLGVHLTRFVAFYFLYLYSLNRLPYDFAVPGGWGDIVIAAAAIVVIIFASLVGRAGLFIWNLAGIIDILFVVATATKLAVADPQSMSELLKLPLSLLPTFLVPIIIFTHIIIFVRLGRRSN